MGANDGTYKKKRYFECRNHHGVFVRPHDILCVTQRKVSSLLCFAYVLLILNDKRSSVFSLLCPIIQPISFSSLYISQCLLHLLDPKGNYQLLSREIQVVQQLVLVSIYISVFIIVLQLDLFDCVSCYLLFWVCSV